MCFFRRSRITKYTQGKLAEVIHTLRRPDIWNDLDTTYIRLLQLCSIRKALDQGRQVHSHIVKLGHKPNNHTSLTLISMYAKCGCFLESHHVLQYMPTKLLDCWTTLITELTHQGHYEQTLSLFWEMLSDNSKTNHAILVCVLNSCAGLIAAEYGKYIHGFILEHGYETNVLVQNSLVKMYCKFHLLQNAESVFYGMKTRNLESWTAILGGYTNHGLWEDAMKSFKDMIHAGMKPNNVAFASILKMCASTGDLDTGRDIHRDIRESGLSSDVLLDTLLITMYAKCGSIREARKAFDQMPKRETNSWNEMIAAYGHHGLHKDAFKIIEKMQRQIIKPDIVTITRMVNTCISLEDLDKCINVHSYIMKTEFKSNITVLNNVLDMYIKCSNIHVACKVFDGLAKRDIGSWNVMVVGYVHHGCNKEALEVFSRMVADTNIKPNDVTYVSVLNACANIPSLNQGRAIHHDIVQNNYEFHSFVISALVDMYSKCGNIEDAFWVFTNSRDRDEACWTSMATGLIQHGYNELALMMSQWMHSDGLTPNASMLSCTLNACSDSGTLENGKQIHLYVVINGLESDVFIANAVVDMYAKCGNLRDAYVSFILMSEKDVVPWTTIITGFARHGLTITAVELFNDMIGTGVKPNGATFTSILIACSHSGLAEEGLECLRSMMLHGMQPSLDHISCLVDLYGRAGCLEVAEMIAIKMPFVAHFQTWMSLLGASRNHSNLHLAERSAKEVLKAEPCNVPASVQLSIAYASEGRWQEKQKIRKSIVG